MAKTRLMEMKGSTRLVIISLAVISIFIIVLLVLWLNGWKPGLPEISSLLMPWWMMALIVILSLTATGFYLYYKKKRIKTEQKLFWAFILMGIALLIVSFYSNGAIEKLRRANRLVSHTLEVKDALRVFQSHIIDLQTGGRGYLINSDEKFLAPAFAAADSIPDKLKQIRQLISDNNEQLILFKVIDSLSGLRIEHSMAMINLNLEGKHDEAVKLFGTNRGVAITDSIRSAVEHMEANENELLIARSDAEARQALNAGRMVGLNFLVQLILLASMYHLMRRNFGTRQKAIDDITKINNSLEERIAERSESLKKSYDRYINTLDNMIEGCQIIGHDWRYIYINKAAEIHNRRPAVTMIGKVYQEEWPGVEETGVYKVLSECMSERISGRIENEFIFPDGTKGWFNLSIQPVPEGIFILSIDITEKIRAEESRRESNERMRILVEEATETILLHDSSGRFLEANQFACNTLGYTREELLALTVMDIETGYNPENVSIVWDEVQPGVSRTVIGRHKRKDGSVFPVEIRIGSILLNNERCFLVFARDISEREKSEKDLNMLMERLDLATRSAALGIWDWDISNDILVWDDQMYSLYGDSEKKRGQPYSVWLASLHPDDRYNADRASKMAVTGIKDYNTEFRVIWPDGSVHWLQANGMVFRDDNGTAVRMLGINYDITQRVNAEQDIKESERIYKYLFDNNPQPMWIFETATLKFLEVNRAAVSNYGWSHEEFLSMTILDIRHPDDKPHLLNVVSKGLKEHDATGEWRHRTKDKRWIIAEIISHAIEYRGKKARLVLSIDITKKKYAEEELRKLNESLESKVRERTVELERANMAKSEFLANMSHEIRTPMNAILGYSELLTPIVRDQIQKKYLNSIKSSGKILLTVINDILDLSKIEAGKLEFDYEYFDSAVFFQEFESIFNFKTKEKGITFNTVIPKNLPERILLDETRLRQVLTNIIGNAVKFTEKGSVTLSVALENRHAYSDPAFDGEEVLDLVARVSDTGIGIPEEKLGSIFNSFVQVRTEFSKGGTGLGLAISERLVRLMNGTIDVSSRLGEGTTFTITIPSVNCISGSRRGETKNKINPADIIFEKASVLVVDDRAINRDYIRDALKDTRLEVSEAESGRQALILIEKSQPDIAIFDIRMPGMDGFELLENCTQNPESSKTTFIAYSASVMKEQREKISKSKFSGLLIKPVRLTELFTELMKWLPYTVKENQQEPQMQAEDKIPGILINQVLLITLLETDFTEVWKKFSRRQPVGEVQKFGENLIALGTVHNASDVINYGTMLVEATASFDIDSMLHLINTFPDLIAKIRLR